MYTFLLQLSKDQRSILTDSYVASTAKKAIEQRMLGFLSYNSYHLPMYTKPGMVWTFHVLLSYKYFLLQWGRPFLISFL